MQRMRKLLADGESFTIGQGEYFVVREAYGKFSVRFMSPTNETISAVDDCFAGFTLYRKRFAQCLITADGPCYVDAIVSEHEIWPAVFSGDSVTNFSHGYSAPAAVGEYSGMQLWNPADSDVLIYIKYCELISEGTITAQSGIRSTAATSWSTNTDDSAGIESAFNNSLTSAAKFYGGSDSSALGSTNYSRSFQYIYDKHVPVDNNRPVILFPGSGFNLVSGSTNKATRGYIQWREIDLT